MATTNMAVQQAFLDGLLCVDSMVSMRRDNLLTGHPTMLLAYPGRSLLFDDEVRVRGEGMPVNDTSALRARKRRETTSEMFRKAIAFVDFDLDTLLGLRSIRQNSWPLIQQMISRIT